MIDLFNTKHSANVSFTHKGIDILFDLKIRIKELVNLGKLKEKEIKTIANQK